MNAHNLRVLLHSETQDLVGFRSIAPRGFYYGDVILQTNQTRLW